MLDMTQAGNLIPSTLKEPIDCSLDFTKSTKQCVEQVRACAWCAVMPTISGRSVCDDATIS